MRLPNSPVRGRWGLRAVGIALMTAIGQADTVHLEVGDDFSSRMALAPQGTTFVVRSGVHRLQSFVPPSNCTVVGEPGAVLCGAVLIEGWAQDGEMWKSTASFPAVPTPLNDSHCGSTACLGTQNLFCDDAFVTRVWSRSHLNGKSWFLDEAEGKVVISFPPAGRTVEFEVGPQSCIGAGDGQAFGRNVTYRGLRVEKYACPMLVGSVALGEGSTAEDCEFAWSSAIGLYIGSGARAVRCLARDNGQDGMALYGSGGVVEDCELHGNAWGGFSLSFQESGMKCAAAVNCTIRRNYFHDNHAPGLWLDIESRQNTIVENITERNEEDGIILEIGCGNTVVRNVSRWNGWGMMKGPAWGGQIEIQNSSGCEVAQNYLEASGIGSERQNAVIIINQPHRGSGSFCGEHSTRGNFVHDNVVVGLKGINMGHNYGSLSFGSYEGFLAAGNVWSGNRYYTASPNRMLFYTFTPDSPWPEPYGSSWVLMPEWRSQGKDVGSEIETWGRSRLARTSRELVSLIDATVGFGYESEKARRTWRRVNDLADDDGDGMPNFWSNRYPAAVAGGGGADLDGDGLSNAEEWTNRTDPARSDTDGDELPDGWEVEFGLDPLHHDAQDDPDGDGVTNVLEFFDGSSPVAPSGASGFFPEEGLTCWFSIGHGVEEVPGGLVKWTERSPFQRSTTPGPAKEVGESVGLPSALEGLNGYGFWSPNAVGLWSQVEEETGPDHPFTLCLVFRCPSIPMDFVSRGLFTSEGGGGGLRMTVQDGVLTAHSIQAGGGLSLGNHRRLNADETVLVTLRYGGASGRSALYVNGEEVDQAGSGKIGRGSYFVLGAVGGMVNMPSAWSEALVYRRALSGSELRALHTYLQSKYFGIELPDAADADFDGVPDSFEAIHGMDPSLPDGLRDTDGDGMGNRAEYLAGLDPSNAREDNDSDGMWDAWERLNGLDLGVDDSGADPDQDGVSNRFEFRDNTSPTVFQPFLTRLPLDALDLWLRADAGLVTDGVSGRLESWIDQSVRAVNATAQTPGNGPDPAVEGGLWMVRWGSGISSMGTENWAGSAENGAVPFSVVLQCRLASLPAGDAILVKQGASSGFAVGLRDGHPFVRPEPGSWILVHPGEVAPGAFVTISVINDPVGGRCSLYLNDECVDHAGNDGPVRGSGGFVLSGPAGYDLMEAMVFRDALSERERLRVGYALTRKSAGAGGGTTDADGDGLPDWWELLAGSDPNDDDGGEDPDFDGRTNLQAYQLGQPGFRWVDTDRDGMPDGWELAHGLNPLVDDGSLDPDADGLENFAEYTLEADPGNAAAVEAGVLFDLADPSHLRFKFRRNNYAWNSRLTVESSLDLSPSGWMTLADATELAARETSEGGLLRISLDREIQTAQRRFFRLRIGRRF